MDSRGVQSDLRGWITKIIFVFSIVAIVPIMWISAYNRPSSDDYNFSEIYTQNAVDSGESIVGILGAAAKTSQEFYNNWQGTYTASFLHSLHPGIYTADEKLYSLTAYIICTVMLLGIVAFVKELLKVFGWSTKYMFPISLVLFLAIIEGLPSPVQGLFWYTGCMSYMFFLGLSLLQYAWMLSFVNSKKINKAIWLLGIINLIVIAGGNHITSFLMILISCGFAVFASYKKDRKLFVSYLIYVVVSTMGFLAVVLAPGTAVRAATEDRQSVIKTMLLSIYNTVTDIGYYTNLPFILSFIIILLLLGRKLISKENSKKFNPLISLVIFILSFGIYCVTFCVPYYATGGNGAGRVSDMRFAIFILLAFINCLYNYGCVLNFVYRHGDVEDELDKIVKLVMGKFQIKIINGVAVLFVVVAMGVVIFFSNRTSVTTNCAMELLSGTAQAYAEEKDNYLKTDLNNPANMPRMIYFSSNMPDA